MKRRMLLLISMALVVGALACALLVPAGVLADVQGWTRIRFLQVLINLDVDGDATIGDDLTVVDGAYIGGDATVVGESTLTGGAAVNDRLELTAGTQVTVTDNCTLTLTSPYQVIVSAANVGITNVVPSGVGMFCIQNEGSYTATFTETGSIFTAGGDIVLPPEGVVVAYYDGTDAWVWADKDN